MTDLAKLVVKLEAQTAKFQKDLAKSEKKVQRFSRKSKDALKGINQLFAGVAFGVLTKKIVDATAQQEKAFKQLEQGIKSTNDAVGFSAKELAGYASELQAATTFGDETIIAAQSKLVSFTKITGDEFLRTTELALDMAARFGTDVSSASLQLGKALNDPVANLSALSRAGIQFTKDQKAMIKSMVDSGNQLGAQKVILSELETQFGGSARAARDTFGGALEALGNNFGDLLESKSGLKEAKKQIEELNTLLADPKTKEAADKLTSSLIGGFSKLVSVLAQVPDFATFLGESIAAAIHGPADLVRINDALSEKQEELLANEKALASARNSFNLREQKQYLANIQALEEEIKLLNEKKELFTPAEAPTFNLGGGDTSGSAPPPPPLSDSTIADTAKELEKATARASQIVSETTPQIDQLQSKIIETVGLFSQGLLDDSQFNQAIANYNSQIGEIVLADELAFEEKLLRLEEQFLTETEFLDAQYETELAMLEERRAQELLGDKRHAALKLKIEEDYAKAKARLEQQQANMQIDQAQYAAQSVIGILGAFAGKSFKAQKALAIAEGIINIVAGVTKALNNPYPANLGFAAQVAAQGAALISTIKSTNVKSSSANLNVSGGAKVSSFSTPDASSNLQSVPDAIENSVQNAQQNANAGESITYNIYGTGNDGQKLGEELRQYIEDGGEIIPVGSRQAEQLLEGAA